MRGCQYYQKVGVLRERAKRNMYVFYNLHYRGVPNEKYVHVRCRSLIRSSLCPQLLCGTGHIRFLPSRPQFRPLIIKENSNIKCICFAKAI